MTTPYRLFGARHSLAALTLILSGLLAACSGSRVPPPEQARELVERYFLEAVSDVREREHLHVEGFRPLRLEPLPAEPGKVQVDCEFVLYADAEVTVPRRLLTGAPDNVPADVFSFGSVPQINLVFNVWFMSGKLEFQPGRPPNNWVGRVVSVAVKRDPLVVSEIETFYARVAGELKNPDFKALSLGFRWQGKGLEQAPVKVQREVAATMRRLVETDYANRPAFQKVLYPRVMLVALQAEAPGADAPPAAIREGFARLLAAEKPGTAYREVLQNIFNETDANLKRTADATATQAREREENAARAAREREENAAAQTRDRERARRSPETFRAMATVLAEAVETYAAANHLPAGAPVDWATLQKTARPLVAVTSAGESLPVTEKDPSGRPFLIGPRVGDGVRVSPETVAELGNQVSGDEVMFWGRFGPRRYAGAPAALDGAKALDAALKKCVAERKLTAFDEVNWASVEPFLEGGNIAFETGGKDPRGRPYEIGPTVQDGVFIHPASVAELRGSVTGSHYGDAAQSFFGGFHPVHRKVTSDGFHDLESDVLAYTMLRFEPGLLDGDKFIDEWASSHDRETYQRDVNNEFVWNKRRQEIREKLRRGLDHYPTKFRVRLDAQLDKYDATVGAFRVQGLTKLEDINLGNNMTARLPSAMTLVGIPMEAGRAQALVERMLQASNSSRHVVCELTVTLLAKVNDPRSYGRHYQANVQNLTFREKADAAPFCVFRL